MTRFRLGILLSCFVLSSCGSSPTKEKDPTPPECAEGEKRCNATQPEQCVNGSWQTTAPCEQQICVDGVCVGECVSGTRCLGNTPQTCNLSGQWEDGVSCASDETCNGGICACNVGTTKCKDDKTVETCKNDGQWVDVMSCPEICSNGQCIACVAGQTRCDGQQGQACNIFGQWGNVGNPCENSTCIDGACMGVCAPDEKSCIGSSPQVCINGAYTLLPPCASFCLNGDCLPGDSTWLGSPCSTDAECSQAGTTAVCARPEVDDPVFQGGPEEGYCTIVCNTSGDCPGVANVCYKGLDGNASEGRCVLGCDLGPDLMFLNDPLDSFKCHGRENVACTQTNLGTVCLPTCGNDTHCAPGRSCDLALGVCVTAIPPGKKFGAACNPMAAQDECGNGTCVTINPVAMTGFCSGRCTLGGDINYGDCGGLANGLCAFLPTCAPGQTCSGAGDFGYCSAGCKAHDECAAPDQFCRKIIPGNSVGYCLPTQACPNGQADCKFAGTMCTQTTVGAYCIDPTFPLGTLTP